MDPNMIKSFIEISMEKDKEIDNLEAKLDDNEIWYYKGRKSAFEEVLSFINPTPNMTGALVKQVDHGVVQYHCPNCNAIIQEWHKFPFHCYGCGFKFITSIRQTKEE